MYLFGDVSTELCQGLPCLANFPEHLINVFIFCICSKTHLAHILNMVIYANIIIDVYIPARMLFADQPPLLLQNENMRSSLCGAGSTSLCSLLHGWMLAHALCFASPRARCKDDYKIARNSWRGLDRLSFRSSFYVESQNLMHE